MKLISFDEQIFLVTVLIGFLIGICLSAYLFMHDKRKYNEVPPHGVLLFVIAGNVLLSIPVACVIIAITNLLRIAQ